MSTNDESASEQIDSIISSLHDWRGEMLSRLRATIRQASPDLVEEVKWKMPSKPQGVAVWTYKGNICIADILKSAVRLTFPKGAQVKDPQHSFNARLDSTSVRAIDFYENSSINDSALMAIVTEAIKLNSLK